MSLEIKRSYSMDNFSEPDILQIYENSKMLVEFCAKSFKHIDCLDNEKKALNYLVNRENRKETGE